MAPISGKKVSRSDRKLSFKNFAGSMISVDCILIFFQFSFSLFYTAFQACSTASMRGVIG